MSVDWYCRIDETTHGPLTGAELQRLAKSGKLRPTDTVKKSDAGKWIPASAVKGLIFNTSPNPKSGPATDEEQPARKRPSARPAKKNIHMIVFVTAGIAAVVMILCSVTIFFTFFRGSSRTPAVAQTKKTDGAAKKTKDVENKPEIDAEKKRKDEAEAKRIAEAAQKAKDEEAKRIAEAAQKAKDEAEAKEVEAKRVAEAAQKAKDEAEAKEVEAKRIAEAAEKAKELEALVTQLIEQLKSPDEPTRLKAIKTLGGKGKAAKAAIPMLFELAKDWKANGRYKGDILRTIEQIGIDKSYLPALLVELQRNETSFIVTDLVGIAGEPAIGPLLKLLDDPLPRTRFRALVALFNNRSLNSSMVPRLMRCLEDADASVRGQAASTIGRIGVEAKDAIPALIKSVEQKNWGAANALAAFGPIAKGAVPALINALKDKTTALKLDFRDPSDVGKLVTKEISFAEQAAAALGFIGPDAVAAVKDLIRATADPRPGVRQQAVFALGKIRSVDAIPKLMAILEKKPVDNDELDKAAARALADLGTPAIPTLLKAADSKVHSVRLGAAIALAQMRPLPDKAVAAIRPFLKDENSVARTRAVVVLGRMGFDGEEAIPDLVEVLTSTKETEVIRKKVADALAEMGEKVGPHILKCSTHENARARRWVAIILGKMKSPPPEAVTTLIGILEKDSIDLVRVAAAEALSEFGPEAKSALTMLDRQAAADKSPMVRRAASLAATKIRAK